jgi:hypothetical protein
VSSESLEEQVVVRRLAGNDIGIGGG